MLTFALPSTHAYVHTCTHTQLKYNNKICKSDHSLMPLREHSNSFISSTRNTGKRIPFAGARRETAYSACLQEELGVTQEATYRHPNMHVSVRCRTADSHFKIRHKAASFCASQPRSICEVFILRTASEGLCCSQLHCREAPL